jgi:hypothetical protein
MATQTGFMFNKSILKPKLELLVPETCSLPYQISYAMKFERSFSMGPGNPTVSRPLENGTFCPISASGSNFNPRNIQYIPVVEIFAFPRSKSGIFDLNSNKYYHFSKVSLPPCAKGD